MAESIGPTEIAYRLELTPPQLKITHAALRAFLNDFGHDERDVHDVVKSVLAKMPDESSIRAISLLAAGAGGAGGSGGATSA